MDSFQNELLTSRRHTTLNPTHTNLVITPTE